MRRSTLPLAEALMSKNYQTLHRAASACSLGKPPQFSYLQFVSGSHGGDTTRNARLEDLSLLRDVLGVGNGFPIRLIEVDIQPTPDFVDLTLLPKAPSSVRSIKQALLSKRLFRFNDVRIYDAS